MSHETAELVRLVYEALNRGDWDELFRHGHADVELTTQRGLNAGTNRGRAAVQAFLMDYRDAFDEVVWEPGQIRETGDHVVVVVTSRGRPRGSSAEITTRNGHLWTISNGRFSSVETFPDPDDALAAAGLSE